MKSSLMIIMIFVITATSSIVSSFTISKRDSEEFTLLQAPKHSIMLRAPRSIGNFFRRVLGKGEKASSSPISSFTDPLSQFGQQPSASAYYPTYAPAMFIPQPGAGGYPAPYPVPPAYGPTQPAAAASAPYASYLPAGSAVSPSSPDFHTVLDSFVRSTGLAPQGSMPADQEAAASSFSQPGVTPAFSWKRLYSFPFYFSTDSGSGSRINIPYMKQHIRRMSGADKVDKAIRDANIKSLYSLRQAQEQQKLLQALQSSEMIATYLQQYLKKQEASNENSLQDKKSVPRRRPVYQDRQEAAASAAAVSARVPQASESKPSPTRQSIAESVYQQQQQQQATHQVPSYYIADQPMSYMNEYANPELYQRISQLDELRRRRLQQASESGHQSASDQLHEQLRTRIVNDPRLLSDSSSGSGASSSASLSDRLDQLQSLSQGLRSIPAPTSLSPTTSSYASTYAPDDLSMVDDSSMSAQESQNRPTIVTYYADPSVPSMDMPSSSSSSSSSSAMVSSSSSSSGQKSYSSDLIKKSKGDNTSSSISLSSSYSMPSSY